MHPSAYNPPMTTGPFRLDDMVAVVTGGSQGIGGAVSIALAQAGASVAVTNLPSKRSDVDAFVRDIEAAGGKARGYELDVSVASGIAPVFDAIASDLGGLHILVNNAGVSSRMSALDVSEEHWNAVHGVNLKGVFFAAQAAARHMLEAGYGRIINIASQLVVTSGPNRAVLRVVEGRRGCAYEVAGHGVGDAGHHRQRGGARPHRHSHDAEPGLRPQ